MRKSIIAIIILIFIGVASVVSVSWILITLQNQPDEPNQAPVILSYNPLINPSIYETESQLFNISANDPDGDPLTYGWYIDQTKVAGNSTSYIFNATNYLSGSYIVIVNVTDGSFVVNHSWVITVSLEGEILRVATTSNPVTMDPIDSWDTISNNMLDQVVETLIVTNLSDPIYPLVGGLAESWDFQTTESGTNITFYLRDNVYFHDGSKLTGECVIHTFERINFFGNWTGTLTKPNQLALTHSKYKFTDGTPIFNDTLSRELWEVTKLTDNYTVTLILNRPFGPAEGLLSCTSSAIVHPDSTPLDRKLELGTDLVIGTGPFKLFHYLPNIEVRFERWDGYWRTTAFWDKILYTYYSDEVVANHAMFTGDVNYLGQGIASLKLDFEVDPDITVTGDGTNPFIDGFTYWYIAFNSVYINETWRKAIGHAFNYTYLIQDIKKNTVVRAHSLVNSHFGSHNWSVVGGTFNIPYARTLIQSMGYGYTSGVPWDVGSQVGDVFTPGNDEQQWKDAKFTPTDVIGANFSNNQWNFRVQPGNLFHQRLLTRFKQDMDLIGIEIIEQSLQWEEFRWMLKNHPNRLHIYYLGWTPDYLAPYSAIYPLVKPTSSVNFAQINNSDITSLLITAELEKDTLQKFLYYERLQYLIHDKFYYHMPLMYDKLYFVHSNNLKGVPYNILNRLYWYPTYREV